jgi:hypothetical protein
MAISTQAKQGFYYNPHLMNAIFFLGFGLHASTSNIYIYIYLFIYLFILFLFFLQYVDKGSILVWFKFSQNDMCNLYHNIFSNLLSNN